MRRYVGGFVMRKYTPRRAGKRWLQDAPSYVLDVVRHRKDEGDGGFDVLFTGELLGTIQGQPKDFAHVYVMGLDLSADGRYCSFELDAYQAAQFRYRNSKRRVRWADVPTAVQNAVREWAMAEVI